MLTNFALISIEELKTVAPRIALYTAVAYVTIRAAGFAMDQASSRLMGFGKNNRS